MSDVPDRRILLVHAHPDDECIGNGATMAKYVAEGAQVTLVTCTLGEQGEVLVPELEHLAADRDDALGKHRVGELADAMRILGVTDHRFLGGEGRYRDTGMVHAEGGGAAVPPDTRPDTFWRADLLEAANELVAVIRETRPQVLVTYDTFGGYGHPDHVQAHRVATYAAALAGAPSHRPDLGEPWAIAKTYWNAMSEGRMRTGLRKLRELGVESPFGDRVDPEGPLPPFITPDAQITAEVDGSEYAERKIEALRAHATQVTPDGPFFTMADHLGAGAAFGTESYRLVAGTPGPTGPDGHETDLFAGVA